MTIAAAEAAPAIGEAATGTAAGVRAGKGAPGAVRTNRGTATYNERRNRFDFDEQKSRRQRVSEKIPRGKISRTNYQPIILMEFVACIVLTAATPIATKKDKQGLSPYAGKDIVKLGAITVTYLILAMISVGGRGPGRLAAWFGGLILLADGLYEASNIARDLQVLSGGGEPEKAAGVAPGAESQPGGILPTPTGTQPPVLGEVP